MCRNLYRLFVKHTSSINTNKYNWKWWHQKQGHVDIQSWNLETIDNLFFWRIYTYKVAMTTVVMVKVYHSNNCHGNDNQWECTIECYDLSLILSDSENNKKKHRLLFGQDDGHRTLKWVDFDRKKLVLVYGGWQLFLLFILLLFRLLFFLLKNLTSTTTEFTDIYSLNQMITTSQKWVNTSIEGVP